MENKKNQPTRNTQYITYILTTLVLCMLIAVLPTSKTYAASFNGSEVSDRLNQSAKVYANEMYTGENAWMAKMLVTYDTLQQEELRSAAEEIVQGAKSTQEKVDRIFDWMLANIEYDENRGFNTPYQVYTQKRGVCSGYALLFNEFLRLVDVPALYVTGRVGDTDVARNELFGFDVEGHHAWSMAYVDGQWKVYDATWGSKDLSQSYMKQMYCTYMVEGTIPYYQGMDQSYLDGFYYRNGNYYYYTDGKLDKNNDEQLSVFNSVLRFRSYMNHNSSELTYYGNETIPSYAAYRNGWIEFRGKRYYAMPNGRLITWRQCELNGINYRFGIDGNVLPSSKLKTEDGFQYKIAADKKSAEIVAYEGKKKEVTIPSKIAGVPVTKIGEAAFYYMSITKVTVPEGVTAIEDEAFIYCGELKQVILPSTLKTIGTVREDWRFSSVFQECWNLNNVVLPAGLQHIGADAFSYTHYETDCFIVPALEKIGPYALSQMGIKKVILTAGTLEIEDSAFAYNDDMKEVYIPATVIKISSRAFRDTKDMTIRTKEDSYAQQFANKMGIKCVTEKNPTLTGLSINKTKTTIELNKTEDLRLIATPLDTAIDSNKIVWSTSNAKIATVTNGKVKAVGFGSCTISAKVGKFVVKCTVTVPERKPSLGTPKIKAIHAYQYGKTELQWNAVKNAQKYEIYRKIPGKSYVCIKTIKVKENSGDRFFFTDTTAVMGQAYYYRIKAVHSVGGKTYTATSTSKKFTNNVPAKVKGVKLSSAKIKATLKWNKVKGASGYSIEKKATLNGSLEVIKNVKTGTTFTDKDVCDKHNYYYRIRAYRLVNGKKVYGEYTEIYKIRVKK